jgi:hypothetical protein
MLERHCLIFTSFKDLSNTDRAFLSPQTGKTLVLFQQILVSSSLHMCLFFNSMHFYQLKFYLFLKAYSGMRPLRYSRDLAFDIHVVCDLHLLSTGWTY